VTAASYVPFGVVAATVLALIWMVIYKRRSQREDNER
jgi:hypothetical protein